MKAYQLKIQIKDSHPPIWRRLIVPAGLSFSQLSIILNEAMGWCGYHLFSFEFYHSGIRIEDGIDEFESWSRMDEELLEAGETLIDTFLDDEEWFTYIYDFGDYWQHRVTIEKVLDDYDKNYAQVVKYKGDTPYEDCGGIYGYYELLEILKNKNHPEYKHMKEWTDNHFTEPFDIENVNSYLEHLYLSEENGEPMTQNELYEGLHEGEPFKRIIGQDILTFHTKAENPLSMWKENNPDELQHFYDLFEQQFENQLNAMENATLKEIFSEYTKEELVEIAKIHRLKGYSKYKKERLVDFICEMLLDGDVMRRYFRFLNKESVDLLESEECVRTVSGADLSYDYLQSGGYAGFFHIWEDTMICIPKEVKQAYRENCTEEWKQNQSKNRTKMRGVLAYLNVGAELYGICPIEQILELYKRDIGLEVNVFEMIEFCEEAPENLKYFIIKGGEVVLKMYKDADAYQALKSVQKGILFYIPNKEEIELLSTKGYLPFDKYMNRLKDFFIEEGDEEEEDAEVLCRSIQFIIRVGGSVEDILDVIETGFMAFEEIMENNKLKRKLFDRLEKAHDHTRLIPLRGNMFCECEGESGNCGEEKIVPFPGGK